tara:strand:+ start:735 stop:1043 length:309 start_codon:yes stop_codon:yes gene_type:complete
MIEKIKKNSFILIGTLLFLYFFLNLLDGERGLISLLKKENLVKNLKLKEKNLIDQIDILEFKNTLLSKNLDKDYVEILLREKFIYSKKGEKIYVLKNHETSN